MSGYLRRLAANARNTSSAIHPVVGPMFATGQDRVRTINAELGLREEESDIRIERLVIVPDKPAITLNANETSVPPLVKASEAVPAERKRGESAVSTIRQEPKRERSTPVREIRAEHFEPLLMERVGRDNSVQVNQVSARNNSQKRDTPATVTGTDRQPDEIEIHIGRIEVAAVLPPPSRPQSKAAHKSVSLDEYLKRGSR